MHLCRADGRQDGGQPSHCTGRLAPPVSGLAVVRQGGHDVRQVAYDLALLAPVPLVHLQDGAVVCAQESKVAFGSRAWELFRELDNLRNDSLVDVYIYASQAPGARPEATWHARYLGHA